MNTTETKWTPSIFCEPLANGRVEMGVSFGEFESQSKAEQAAEEIKPGLAGLAQLWSLDQLQDEITRGKSLGDETLEQIIESYLREQCDQVAEDLDMTELWKQSQSFPNFKKAWRAWLVAWEKWVGGNRRFPETKGPNTTRYLWMQKQFLAAISSGRGDKSEFYQNHSWLLFTAAQIGDVEFFKQFAETKRRKIEPRLVQHCLMLVWMPAALWSCSQDAVAKLMHGKCKAWGNSPPFKKDEAVRRAWQLLKLSSSRDKHPRIVDFNSDWQPIFNR